MIKKIVGYLALIVVVLVGTTAGYFYFRSPKSRPAPDIKIALTPARVERGAYMWNIGYCDGCHSQRDEKTFALIESGRGRGNVIPERMPGRVVAPNITPDKETGIGNWTDGEIMRAIREGVDNKGRALFPMMPYDHLRYMSDEDVIALVAFMRTLKPIHNPLPTTELEFPVNVLIKGVPKPVTHEVKTPNRNNPMQYGEYLVTMSHCDMCHTPGDDKGRMIADKRFAGGREFNFAGHKLKSANITPDSDTGIGGWSFDYFKQRIYTYKDKYPDRFTIMPWHNVAQLPEKDLEAIYTYLRAQQPVQNKVYPFGSEIAQR